MALADDMKQKADYFNTRLKAWEPDGTAWIYLLGGITAAAEKGEYSFEYCLGLDLLPESVLLRLREQGFKASTGSRSETRMVTADPDTFETVSIRILTVRWE